MGTNTPALVLRTLALALILNPNSLSHAQCGEEDKCQGMGEKHRALMKAHIASHETKEMCTHVIAAHIINYQPTGKCEEAEHLRKHLITRCFDDTLTALIPHSPLCQTRAQHTFASVIGLHITIILTTAVLSEWAIKLHE